MPLRISQMKSMLKMQRVAPQIKSIQEKYKEVQPARPRKSEMNEEISALYKTEGVNRRRMPAASDPDASLLCLLPDARVHGSAPCAVALGA